ncbi:TerD family protein [Yinghuangia seranimata]|uniref:TerD family protein n=1 Tax=Yinghuangia seranimata TaxID=408067 RepID=UPI00248CA5BB|nr:TerD family protein [Yinghuangia seranimata]MDI2127411.1 TerD family protein [Yinghuangia seranimata]
MRTFAMGEKARLADLTPATALRIDVTAAARGTEIAAFCFALDEAGRIGGHRPPVSAARPASLASAVALVEGGGADAAFDLDLDAVADDVHRLLFVVASVGPEIALDSGGLVLVADGVEIAGFAMTAAEMKGQRALILGEVYRRDGWRFGAVGQGYRDGLEQLVRDHGADPRALLGGGTDTEAAPEPEPEPEPVAEPPEAPVAASEPEPAVEPAAEPEPVAEPAAESASEPEPAAESEPEPEPAAEPVAEPVPPVPPAPVPSVATYEGSGDRILRITRPVESGPVVAEITCGGAGNFAVWTLNTALEQDKLLVNEIGAYTGRVLLDERGTRTERLKIESDGAWTISVQPPTAAPWLIGPATGHGPEVLRWTGPRTVVAMTHGGHSNFMVRVYAETPDRAEDPYLASLANTIGPYDGESILPAGPCLVEIEADGDWTVTPETG